MLSLTFTVLPLALSACLSDPPYLDPADYDRDCVQSTDCALVVLTDVCDCHEPPSAINVREVARANADVRDVADDCPDVGCTPTPRPWGDAVCNAGQCTFVEDPHYYSRPGL